MFVAMTLIDSKDYVDARRVTERVLMFPVSWAASGRRIQDQHCARPMGGNLVVLGGG